MEIGKYEITAEVKAEGYKDLTLKATLTIASSETGVTFEAYNRYIVIKPYTELPHTIEMDIKLNANISGNAGSLFSNLDWGVYGGASVGVGRLFHTDIVDGVLRLQYTNKHYTREDVVFNGVDLRTGDWVHIAITIDAANRKAHLYVNGELKVSKSINAELTDLIKETRYHIGGDNRTLNPSWFKGEIREVAAFSDIRSAEEIKTDYQNGVNLIDDNLIAQYYLTSYNVHSDITDNSCNGYWVRYEDTWYDEQEIEMDYAYSFAVVGDTQMLNYWAPAADGTKHDQTKITNNMNNLYKWILNNQESQKIQHVFGLGDITETWAKAEGSAQLIEWQRAKDAMYQMNGKLSYSIIRGNHDESKYMNRYFGEQDTLYRDQITANGAFYDGSINTFYKEMTIGSVQYLFIGLDYGANDAELAWANKIVSERPNHRVIVTTHGYLDIEGNAMRDDYPHAPHDNSDVDDGGDYNNGEDIWNEFISLHANIFLVMCGHQADEDITVSQAYGKHGNVVTQILIDFQDVDKQLVEQKHQDPAGIVTMLYFNEDGTKIEVAAYSTVRNMFYKKYNHFTIDLEGVCKDNHKLTHHSAIKETCTTGGTLEYYSCSTCGTNFDKDGNVLLNVITEATGHSYDNGVRNENEMIYTCENCGDSYKEYLNCTIEVNHLYLDGSVASPKEVLEKSENTMYIINAKTINGYVASHDYVKVYTSNKTNIINIYYSQVDVWDGKTVSSKLAGSGTETDPYLIQSGADLAYFKSVIDAIQGAAGVNYKVNQYEGQYFKMTKSIDLNGANFQIGCHVTWNDYQGFAGIFDGNNCSIRGLNINNTASTSALFATIQKNGVLKNLSVYGTVVGSNTSAGVVGYLLGKMENVTNYVNVTANSTVGGVTANAENNTSNLINCVNYGNINGASYIIGGIAGSLGNNATNCVNYGDVTAGSESAGGIGGTTKNTGTISGCYNYGKITGTKFAGGVIGNLVKPIYDSVNYGTVVGNGQRGGVVGISTALIKNCTNYGLVTNATSGWNVGGIVGETSANVEDCTNYGEVSGITTHVGGVVGSLSSGNITNCVNEGKINGFSWGAGGIVANIAVNTSVVSGCINRGEIMNGQGQAGGIVGKAKGTISGCENFGAVLSGAAVGGIVGDPQNDTTTKDCVDHTA